MPGKREDEEKKRLEAELAPLKNGIQDGDLDSIVQAFSILENRFIGILRKGGSWPGYSHSEANDILSVVCTNVLHRDCKITGNVYDYLWKATANAARDYDRGAFRHRDVPTEPSQPNVNGDTSEGRPDPTFDPERIARARREHLQHRLDQDRSNDPAIVAERADILNRVKDAILELSEEHREVVILRYHVGMKLREIATELDISFNAVRRLLKSALERLYSLLSHLKPELEQ